MRLLKIVSVLFMIFLFAGIAYSAEISYGFKLAPAFSVIEGNHSGLGEFSSEEGLGFSVGSYARISTDDRILALQSELLLTYTRTKISMEDPSDNFNLRICYLEIPVMMKGAFPLPIGNYFAPFIFTGPLFGVKIADSSKGNSSGLDVSPFELGVIVGAGVDFENISIEVRYSRDLKKIDDDLRKDVVHFFFSRKFW